MLDFCQTVLEGAHIVSTSILWNRTQSCGHLQLQIQSGRKERRTRCWCAPAASAKSHSHIPEEENETQGSHITCLRLQTTKCQSGTSNLSWSGTDVHFFSWFHVVLFATPSPSCTANINETSCIWRIFYWSIPVGLCLKWLSTLKSLDCPKEALSAFPQNRKTKGSGHSDVHLTHASRFTWGTLRLVACHCTLLVSRVCFPHPPVA